MEGGKSRETITCAVCGEDITSSKKEILKGHYYCLSCYSDAIANSSQESDITYLKKPIKNSIGTIIEIIGVCIIIVGFFMGLAMEERLGAYSYTFEFTIALSYWIIGFISGMLFVGLSEIINLLHKINEKI